MIRSEPALDPTTAEHLAEAARAFMDKAPPKHIAPPSPSHAHVYSHKVALLHTHMCARTRTHTHARTHTHTHTGALAITVARTYCIASHRIMSLFPPAIPHLNSTTRVGGHAIHSRLTLHRIGAQHTVEHTDSWQDAALGTAADEQARMEVAAALAARRSHARAHSSAAQKDSRPASVGTLGFHDDGAHV